MSLHRVVGIAGNLKRPSRTRAVVEAVAAALARRRDVDLSVYDLLDAGPGLDAAYARGDLTPHSRKAGMTSSNASCPKPTTAHPALRATASPAGQPQHDRPPATRS